MRKDNECDWVFIGVAEECSLCIHAYGADSHAWGVAFSEEEGVHKAHNERGELLTHKNIEQGDVVWITARYNESSTLSNQLPQVVGGSGFLIMLSGNKVTMMEALSGVIVLTMETSSDIEWLNTGSSLL
ncbi:hypothetical protein Pelo_17630 [Pelomyxa schiedti]|nr:hypothetical protein Pelo_17630 [Pelomyxa schiedti]